MGSLPPRAGAPVTAADRDPAAPLDSAAFQRLLALEVERAMRYDRPLALARLLPGGHGLEALSLLARQAIRRVDAAAVDAEGVWLLLPEVGATANVPVERVLIAAQDGTRAGLARCPVDAESVAHLTAAAARAAARAAPGTLSWAEGDDDRVIIGDRTYLAADPLTRRVFRQVRELARSDLPVLITGETGTGKEIAARALHQWSTRHEAPYLAFNCAALGGDLVESELFGHRKGAFTGATADHRGLFERADGGTLFIDEISEASPAVQSKLLRALQEGEIRRVGDAQPRRVDVRIVAAMNRVPEAAVADGLLRADLYYRLEVGRVQMPPLRARPGDVLALARWHLRQARPPEWPAQRLSPALEAALVRHPWPGNVRELENLMRWAARLIPDTELTLAHLAERPWHPGTGPAPGVPASPGGFRPIKAELAELEARRMAEALAATGGNQSEAAALIDMPRRTFTAKLKTYGLTQARPRGAR